MCFLHFLNRLIVWCGDGSVARTVLGAQRRPGIKERAATTRSSSMGDLYLRCLLCGHHECRQRIGIGIGIGISQAGGKACAGAE